MNIMKATHTYLTKLKKLESLDDYRKILANDYSSRWNTATVFMIIRNKLNINSSVTVKYLPKPRKTKTVRGNKYSNRLINDFTNIIESKLAIFVKDV